MSMLEFKPSQEALDGLRQRTDDPFEFAVPDSRGGILFAGPLPPEYGDLPYERAEDGSILMSEEDLVLFTNAWSEYEAKFPAEDGDGPRQRQYRTRKQAQESGAITDMPDRLALPSRTPYENALTLNENSAAFLLQVLPQLLPELHFEDGTLYFHNTEAYKVNLVQFRDRRMETVKNLDVPFRILPESGLFLQ